MDMVWIALLVALSFYVVMVKIGITKFLRFHWQTDVIVSGILATLFIGSFTGMVVGILAGLFISFFLSITKRIVPIGDNDEQH